MTVQLKTERGIYGITSQELHYWWNIAGTQFLVSNEHAKSKHTLWSFDNVDDAVTYLYGNGFNASAHEIHKHNKGI